MWPSNWSYLGISQGTCHNLGISVIRNQCDKLLGVRITGMQSKVGSLSRRCNYTMELHEEVKKNPKTKYPYLLVDVFQISRTRFILRG